MLLLMDEEHSARSGTEQIELINWIIECSKNRVVYSPDQARTLGKKSFQNAHDVAIGPRPNLPLELSTPSAVKM